MTYKNVKGKCFAFFSYHWIDHHTHIPRGEKKGYFSPYPLRIAGSPMDAVLN